jgi:hypothetical protein
MLFYPERIPFDTIVSSQLFPDLYQQHITLGNLDLKWGDIYNDRSIIFMCALARRGYTPIVEFGTFRGRTTYNLALNSKEKIYTVDIGSTIGRTIDTAVHVKGQEYDQYIAGELFLQAQPSIRDKINLIIGDSTKCDLSFLRGTVGMIFIDGGHSYNVCKSDTYKALELVRKGGILIWDDYGSDWPEVRKFLNELSFNHKLYYLSHERLVIHITE